MAVLYDNLVIATAFTVLGGVLGIFFMLVGVYFIPKITDKFTPDVNEGKEIAKGNLAVATYFGRVVGAAIIGMSIIVAAAVIAGIHG
ncbi:DUF350 domain-containing protein [Candidatus Parvarchaeota archaeon]|nr:DUF350 domain-containing protein [Candidatus Parvarchaeota archaeon]